jgi:alginate O-acetyltransferase complex protein AlgI
MSLASSVFILIFLPLTLLLYYRLLKTSRAKMIFLLVVSALFYAAAGWQFLPVLLALSLLTFFSAKKGWYLPGILVNLGALALFKYWDFGVTYFNRIMSAAHLGFVAGLLSLGLPLGISFFVFKHVGYLLDIKNKRYPLSDDLWTFLTFSVYFPQISAGPISSYKDTAGQFSSLPERLETEQATSALVHISYGLAKKVLIADQIGLFLASPVNTTTGFAGFIPSWFMVIAFAVQLYFDFSGYTDMALGVSALLGVRIPKNFNSPYLATDPGNFWVRWHISLSTWFRNYLFFPLSRSLLKKWGTHHQEIAQYTSNLITMTLIGLWHGGSWNYVLWGLYHGILLNIHAWWKRTGHKIPLWIGQPLLLVSILIGWALFMSPSFAYFRHLFSGLIGWRGGPGSPILLQTLWQSTATLSLLVGIPLALSGYGEAASLIETGRATNKWIMIFWGILVALSLLFMQNQVNFLYVHF